MYEIKPIAYSSKEYDATLELRNEVMRKPLGLNIYEQDFTWEERAFMIGAFEDESLCGVGVLTMEGNIAKVEYLCVDTNIQKSGLGGTLLAKLEEIAKEKSACKICMDARVSALEFYKKHGYMERGEVFLMDVAPVPHVVMEKNFKEI